MEHLEAATPWILLTLGILVTMLTSLIRIETRKPAQLLSGITLFITLLSSVHHLSLHETVLFQNCFEASPLTYGLLALFSVVGLFFTLGFSDYLSKEKINISDYYHLFLILIFGASTLTASKSLLLTFVALELMSLPVYTLVGFRRNDPRSNEAAIKYFILGGVLGAVFLMGAAYIFGATGELSYAQIFNWTSRTHGNEALLILGHVLVMIAFLFKVAAVPFHFWKPDVYEGAPISVTGTMTTIVSCASMIALTRLTHLIDFSQDAWRGYLGVLESSIRILAVLSLLVGSLVMITQNNLKRTLAYSAISHTGFLLMALLSGLTSQNAFHVTLIYLLGYSVMSSGVFLLLGLSNSPADSGVELIDVTGLMKRSPIQAALWSVFLFSMVGIPFTVGFFTKYVVLLNSVHSGETPVAILAVLCAVVSSYGYLRPVALMTMRDSDPGAATWSQSLTSQIVVALAAGLTIFLGIMPNAMIQLLRGIELTH